MKIPEANFGKAMEKSAVVTNFISDSIHIGHAMAHRG